MSSSSSSSAPRGKKRKAVEIGPVTLETLCDIPIDHVGEIAKTLKQDDLEALMRTALQSVECWKHGRVLWEVYLAKFRRPDELKVFELGINHGDLVHWKIANEHPRSKARDSEFDEWYDGDFEHMIGDDVSWGWLFGLVVATDRKRAAVLFTLKLSEGLGISPKAKMLKLISEMMVVEPHPLNKVYSEEQVEIFETDKGLVQSND